MANLSTSLPHHFTAQKRARAKVITTHVSIDPEWNKKIEDYTQARCENVKQRFINSPFLLASFFEFLGLAPKELKDIEDNVRIGDARKALDELDDCIDKFISWRLKLSEIISIQQL